MRLETWQAPPGDRIPNNPRFPVLVYRGVEAVTGADAARALFAEHGWGGSWVASVFDFHHFHSTSHEALAVVSGHATIELGGPAGRRSRSPPATCSSCPPAPATAAPRRATASASSAPTRRARRTTTCCARTSPTPSCKGARADRSLGPPPQDPVGGEGVGNWA